MNLKSLHYAVISQSSPEKAEPQVGVLTIRNVDDAVIVALKKRARANHRSLEGELRYLLERHATGNRGLGVVRERARIAAAFGPTPTVAGKTSDVPEAADDTRPDSRADDAAWFGAMRDTGEVVGDLVSPASDLSDWDVLRSETGRSGRARPRDVDGQ